MPKTKNNSINSYNRATWQQIRYYHDLLYRPCADYLLLPYGEDGTIESIAVANLDETGEICRLFTCDERWQKEDLNGWSRIGRMLADVHERDESVCYDVTAGAIWCGLLKSEYGSDYLGLLDLSGRVRTDSPLSWAFEVNVRRFVGTIPWRDPARHEFLECLFGYLYAKAMELEYLFHDPSGEFQCRYRLDDIRDGLIHSELDAERQRLLEEALDYGRALYAYFLGHQSPSWADTDAELYYFQNLSAALMAVQSIGRLNSRRGLKWEAA